MPITLGGTPTPRDRRRTGNTRDDLMELMDLTLGKDPRLEETEGWAQIAEYPDVKKASARASYLRGEKANVRPGPSEDWEFAADEDPESGNGRLWARYVGDTS